MKTSSQYPVLDNRPIDQWKVIELKHELKRRKLTTKGLKADLVNRLDEALRMETDDPQDEGDKTEAINDVEVGTNVESVKVGKDVETVEVGTVVSENVDETLSNDDGECNLSLNDGGKSSVVDSFEKASWDKSLEGIECVDVFSIGVDDKVCESLFPETVMSAHGFPSSIDEMRRANEDLKAQQGSDAGMKLDIADPTNQVYEVSINLGLINSISTDSMSVNENNESKDNIIDDNVKLVSNVKLEMVQPSSSDIVPDGGESSHPEDVDEPQENTVSVEETDNNVIAADMSRKNHSADFGSSGKLNVDQSSGNGTVEEDALESKQIDSKYNSKEVGERAERSEVIDTKDGSFAAMDIDLAAEDNSIRKAKNVVASSFDKRKLPEAEAVLSNEPSKRQQRWKSENNMVKDPKISNIPPGAAFKNVPTPAIPNLNFSRSESVGANNTVQEREVPPSAKAATNSLRIDRFLRPFTLKAVQEFLAKTGTVTSFWMDHIKTHCYITYKSVEEAVDTRNAVYNLQWPPNGGHNLVADFIDPEEVKLRVEVLFQPPPAPMSTGPSTTPEPSSTLPQPSRSPRQVNLKLQKSQRSTPAPPPPLSNPGMNMEWAHALPPVPSEKVEAPILTLDDLYRKTKATPRIYYLPLSKEQVCAMLERRKNSRQ